MKIRWHGMAASFHSWPYVSNSLAREMKNFGHDIYIKSTDGLKFFPKDLRSSLLPGYHNHISKGPAEYIDELGNEIMVDPRNPLPEIPDKNFYDLECSYTILMQSPRRHMLQSRARALIWNLDNSIFPPGWKEYHRPLDYILPSSQFSYNIFKNNGIPESKMIVVPHGVDTKIFNKDIPPYKLKTQKKVKILCNCIQPHGRKLYDRIFKGYLDAFTSKDDVCLVLKTKFKTPDPQQTFEIDVKKMLEDIYNQYNDPPEIEVLNDIFIDDIGSLYTACDIVVNMSSIECFWLPGIESLACGNLVIAPRYGGQLDFLNDDNSLLVNTKEMLAPASHQYWVYNEKAITGDPDTRHFTELLRHAYENLDMEKERVREASKKTVEKFSWSSAAKMILDLPIPKVSFRLSNKKKVLYIIPYGMIGGGETWVKETIKQLDKSIYEPHVAFLNSTQELKNMFDCNIEDFTNSGQFNALMCAIESGDYSIIHFYNSFSVYSCIKEVWKNGWRCRVVETVHSELNWNDSMVKVATRDKFITMIIAVSQTLAQKLNKLGNKNVAFMPQPIDYNRFKIERNKKVLEDVGINGFTVGYVGRLSPEKNIPAILQCAKNLPEISFVIVGDGPQESSLKQMATKNVYFVGRKTDVEKYYSAFDILMLPSIMEGMPLVILEAMASGTPVITSNVGAISEVVKNGYNGLLAEPNNISCFISSIKTLQNIDIWNTFSNRCKETVAKLEANTTNINQIYKLMF